MTLVSSRQWQASQTLTEFEEQLKKEREEFLFGLKEEGAEERRTANIEAIEGESRPVSRVPWEELYEQRKAREKDAEEERQVQERREARKEKERQRRLESIRKRREARREEEAGEE